MIAATAEAAYFSSTTLTASEVESSPPEASSPVPDSSSSSNTGAIVGGVVGGIAVVAIAVCVVVWIIVRRRRSARDHTPPSQTPGQDHHMGQIYAPPVSQQNQYAGYQEQYKYQPVAPAVPPPQPIHEVAGDTHINDRTGRAELGT